MVVAKTTTFSVTQRMRALVYISILLWINRRHRTIRPGAASRLGIAISPWEQGGRGGRVLYITLGEENGKEE
jgi:hypothetical protein